MTGGLKIHWWAPLQTKGFLKIVQFFVALIALCLVGSFTVITSVDFVCEDEAYNYTITASYPFRHFKRELVVNNITDITRVKFEDGGVPRVAEFFVGWSVMTLFYCIATLLGYMFVTANERFQKSFDLLVVLDLILHIVWIMVWFITSVTWAVAFHQIDRVLNNYMDNLEKKDCIQEGAPVYPKEKDRDTVIYVQAQIAVVFGFLVQALLVANIGWLIIDTSWYINWRARRGHSRL